MPKPNPLALRAEVANTRRRRDALIVIAITPDDVAFSVDPKLSVRDAEATVLAEMPRLLRNISEQRQKQGVRP